MPPADDDLTSPDDSSEEVEEDDEEETEEIPRSGQAQQRRPPIENPAIEAELSEAELAMLAAKKRHEEEEAAKLHSYEEHRRLEREQVDKELRELKEKQELRRKQRKEEELEFAHRLREEEMRRLKEEAERKAKHEADARKREEERKKRQEKVGNLAPPANTEGRNYVVSKSKQADNQGDGPANKTSELSAEQKAEARKAFLAAMSNRKQKAENMGMQDLKQRILSLHNEIIRGEAEKYDLEKRLELQEYDLRELTDRQRQVARNKALQKGLDPTEDLYSNYPPKINVTSKFDKQLDRRPFKEIRDVYENPIVPRAPALARGTARPPDDWGRKINEELEQIRKNLEQPKYVELVKVESARPPLQPIPLSLPSSDQYY